MGEDVGVEIPWWGRSLIGLLGGVAAVVSKYLGQDHAYYLRLLDLGDHQTKIDNLWLGYYIMGPSLMFLGALVAWASYENHRLKLLAIAVAGPALITTWAGGATAATKFSLNMIDSAYAADAAVTTNQDVSVGNAIKLFFGIGKDDDRFRVVVGSYKDRTEAALVVERIKKEDPALVVFVGERQPNNQFYPVIVGDYVSYPEATKLKDRVQSLNAVSGAYLSPYRYR